MCGSRRVKREAVQRYLSDGTKVTVQADTCLACGERYFDPEAIDAIRLARARSRTSKRERSA